MNTPRRPQRPDPMQEQLEILELLRKGGVDPAIYVNALASERPGFELPGLIKQQVLQQALLNRVATTRPAMQAIPKHPVLIGHHYDDGSKVFLDLFDIGNLLILGPTKTGKNNFARQLARSVLPLGPRFEIVGQKGDELNDVDLWPRSIYLPIQRDPWADWSRVGPNDDAFYFAMAEAFAIPKAVAQQTTPEIAFTVKQMALSDPEISWVDLIRTLRWKSQQPGGRDKHATAMGLMAPYAAWLGDRAYVQKGFDIRSDYPLVVLGCFAVPLDDLEVFLGTRLVREQFEALGRGHSREPRVFIFIPEGQLLFSRELEYARRGHVSYLTRLFSTANSMGIALVVAIQAPSKASSHVVANCASVAVHRQDSPEEAAFCTGLLGLTEEAIPELMSIPLGVAYVKTPGWERPIKVRVPLVDLGPSLTPAQAEARFQQDYQRIRSSAKFARPDPIAVKIDWGSIGSEPTAAQDSPQTPISAASANSPLAKHHYEFLRDLIEHREDGVKKRYDRLGMGVSKGNAILAALKAAGCLEVTQQPSSSPFGGRGRLVPTITARGRALLEAYERSQQP